MRQLADKALSCQLNKYNIQQLILTNAIINLQTLYGDFSPFNKKCG